MVLVTGVTGSGKSSTMAAMVNYINQHENRHILTLENPIEFLHTRHPELPITQREIGSRHRQTSRWDSAPRCGRIPTSS